MKTFFLFIIMCFSSTVYADIDEVNNAVCQILSETMDVVNNKVEYKYYTCTAFCYKEDEKNIYCLSCGHCYKTSLITVVLTHDITPQNIAGEIVYHNFVKDSETDVCIVRIHKVDFVKYPLLKPLKFARKTPIKGYIWTHGCSLGSRPTAFKGKIIPRQSLVGSGIAEGNYIFFRPQAKVGRSGSPILDTNYEIIGMVNMKWGDFGIGITKDRLLEEIENYEKSSAEKR